MKIIVKNASLQFKVLGSTTETLTSTGVDSHYPSTVDNDGTTAAMATFGTLKSKMYDIEGKTGTLTVTSNGTNTAAVVAVIKNTDGAYINPAIGHPATTTPATVNLSDYPNAKTIYVLYDEGKDDTVSCVWTH